MINVFRFFQNLIPEGVRSERERILSGRKASPALRLARVLKAAVLAKNGVWSDEYVQPFVRNPADQGHYNDLTIQICSNARLMSVSISTVEPDPSFIKKYPDIAPARLSLIQQPPCWTIWDEKLSKDSPAPGFRGRPVLGNRPEWGCALQIMDRDQNRDLVVQEHEKQNWRGYAFAHQHHEIYDYGGTRIGANSMACHVINGLAEHLAFMNIAKATVPVSERPDVYRNGKVHRRQFVAPIGFAMDEVPFAKLTALIPPGQTQIILTLKEAV